jgi:hypothetical protein
VKRLFVLVALLACGCHRRRTVHRDPAPILHVPRVDATLTLDGELEEEAWQRSARTGAFLLGGREARPYSEARFLWGNGKLYVGLYAADEDIRAAVKNADGPVWLDDAFHLELAGAVTDARANDYAWQSGIELAVDMDGTLGDASDDDEEWVVEAAIPLDRLQLPATAGTIIPIALRRCDRPKNAQRVCASTRVRLMLD